MHFDWGASQFLTKQFQIGLVGYVYKERGCDSGAGDRVGCIQSQVVVVGPQIGFIFPVGDMQGYINLKGYKEFAAENRADGCSSNSPTRSSNDWPCRLVARLRPTTVPQEGPLVVLDPDIPRLTSNGPLWTQTGLSPARASRRVRPDRCRSSIRKSPAGAGLVRAKLNNEPN